ncbi:MAG: radical SAM protein [Desulfamplus sp.]|nr:radical SAM protein [Desulfamplus sp.]
MQEIDSSRDNADDAKVEAVIQKISSGERISIEEGLALYCHANILTLANLADQRRFKLHPDRTITFVVDRNINYTNVCMSGCLFCAFYKVPAPGLTQGKRRADIQSWEKGYAISSEKGYVISKESLHQKIEETIALGGTQILLQGGMNPELGLDYYIDLLKYIKSNFEIHVHGFSPPEISWLAEKSSLTVSKIVSTLKDAGLGSIPGGGAEILCDEIRDKVSPNKCTAGQWLEVMRTAHESGLKSSATMMFGHIESPSHIFEHLDKIRSLQDRTGGFTAFIPWTFQPDNTRLVTINTDRGFINKDLEVAENKPYTDLNNRKIKIRKASAVEYLRVLALSRIFLDNFENIQASWVTQGDKIAQTALFYGANDMGSTMIEENVVASAGVAFMLPEKEIRRLIEEAGFLPRQRDCFYNLI